MHLRTLNIDRWEIKANKILSNFNIYNPDEIDMYTICYRYGVKIFPLDEPFVKQHMDFNEVEGLKSFSIPSENGRRGIIFLQSGLDHIEKKILLAEEFCHIYSHNQNQLQKDLYPIGKVESQAKRMSAYLLMPFKFIKDVLNFAIEEAVMISDIADYFLVTEEFVQYRLKLLFNHNVDCFLTIRGQLGFIELDNE